VRNRVDLDFKIGIDGKVVALGDGLDAGVGAESYPGCFFEQDAVCPGRDPGRGERNVSSKVITM